MKLWKTALIAFVAMFFSDLFYTVMVVYEAHYSMVMAAIMDELGWIATTVCTTAAVTEFGQHGWFTKKAKVLFVSISAANMAGTCAGVALSLALR